MLPSTIIHLGARKEGGKKKETLRASSVARLQSRAWSFLCLARTRSTDYEKRETARSIQQNSSSCASRCGTQSPPTFPYGCLILLAGFLTFLKRYIFFLV